MVKKFMSLISQTHTHSSQHNQINFKPFSAIIVYKTEKYWSNECSKIAFYCGQRYGKICKIMFYCQLRAPHTHFGSFLFSSLSSFTTKTENQNMQIVFGFWCSFGFFVVMITITVYYRFMKLAVRFIWIFFFFSFGEIEHIIINLYLI